MFDKDDFIIYFVIAFIGFIMYLLGGGLMESKIHKEAVKANAAYWTVDESGFTKFHWITE